MTERRHNEGSCFSFTFSFALSFLSFLRPFFPLLSLPSLSFHQKRTLNKEAFTTTIARAYTHTQARASFLSLFSFVFLFSFFLAFTNTNTTTIIIIIIIHWHARRMQRCREWRRRVTRGCYLWRIMLSSSNLLWNSQQRFFLRSEKQQNLIQFSMRCRRREVIS